MLTQVVEVSVSDMLLDTALQEAGVESLPPSVRARLQEITDQLLWQSRVVLVASTAQLLAQQPKRRGRPRKNKVAKPNGGLQAAAPVKRRGRRRKVAENVGTPDTTVAPATQA